MDRKKGSLVLIMKMRQLSVFVENRTGRVAEVTRILADHAINIRVISLADSHDCGIIRLVVNDVDRAIEILRAHQFTVHDTEVLAVEIPDAPGGMAGVMDILFHEKINVSYLYGFVERSGEKAILIFRFEKADEALRVLQGHGLRVLNGNDLYKL